MSEKPPRPIDESSRVLAIPLVRRRVFVLTFPADLTQEDLCAVYATLRLWEPHITVGAIEPPEAAGEGE